MSSIFVYGAHFYKELKQIQSYLITCFMCSIRLKNLDLNKVIEISYVDANY